MKITAKTLAALGAKREDNFEYHLNLEGVSIVFNFDDSTYSGSGKGEWVYCDGDREVGVATIQDVMTQLVRTGYEMRKQEVKVAKDHLRELEEA